MADKEMTPLQKRQLETRARKAGMTPEEYAAKVNAPYVATAKNIAENSLAGSNNMGSNESAAIDVSTTKLPSTEKGVTETVDEAASYKLGTDTEGNGNNEIKALNPSTEKSSLGSINSGLPYDSTKSTSASSKQQKKGKIKSILQAYYDGELDKSERDYLIADTLGTFARNLGKDIGNVAAAYSGGTASGDREQSMWESRPEALLKQGTTAQEAAVANSDKQIERLKYIPAQRFIEDANAERARGNESAARILELVGAASTQGVDVEEYVLSQYASNPEFKQLVDNAMQAAGNAAGALGSVFGFISGNSK